jgi:hypothetical protein
MQRPMFKIISKILLLALFISNTIYSQDLSSTKKIIAVTKEAYKAYDIRRLVINEILKTHSIRQQLVDYRRSHGDFSGVNVKPADHDFSIDYKTGVIKVDLTKVHKIFSSGDYIAMRPEIDNDYFSWQCHTNVTSNFVPMSCQE